MKGGVMIMDILLGRCPTGLAACVQENHLFLICHTCRTPHPHRSFKPPLLTSSGPRGGHTGETPGGGLLGPMAPAIGGL
jgi:hypothetical protein